MNHSAILVNEYVRWWNKAQRSMLRYKRGKGRYIVENSPSIKCHNPTVFDVLDHAKRLHNFVKTALNEESNSWLQKVDNKCVSWTHVFECVSSRSVLSVDDAVNELIKGNITLEELSRYVSSSCG